MNSQHHNEVMGLEKRFWQALVDRDTETAVSMLAEPALLVSGHGPVRIDHDTYRQMADKGPMLLKDFQLGRMDVVFPSPDVAVLTYEVTQTVAMRDRPEETTQKMADSSTWIRQDGRWVCALHTETPLSH